VKRFVTALCWILAATPAAAHEHCLGHHWTSPAHLREIRLQLALIGSGLALWGLAVLIGRLWRAR